MATGPHLSRPRLVAACERERDARVDLFVLRPRERIAREELVRTSESKKSFIELLLYTHSTRLLPVGLYDTLAT